MKKTASFIIAVLMLFTCTYADEISGISVTSELDNISLSGSIDSGENQQIFMYIENPLMENVYIYQTKSDADGTFDFSVTPSDGWVYGTYTAYFSGYETTAPAAYEFYYGNEEVISETTVCGKVYNSRILISGDAGAEGAGKTVMVMLYKTANVRDLTESDIGYIGEGKADSNGKYNICFDFNGNTDEYTALVYINGANANSTITKAVSEYELTELDGVITEENGKKIFTAKLTNFNKDSLGYTMILAGYNVNGGITDVAVKDKTAADGQTETDRIEIEVSSDTVKVKAMVWKNLSTIVPVYGIFE